MKLPNVRTWQAAQDKAGSEERAPALLGTPSGTRVCTAATSKSSERDSYPAEVAVHFLNGRQLSTQHDLPSYQQPIMLRAVQTRCSTIASLSCNRHLEGFGWILSGLFFPFVDCLLDGGLSQVVWQVRMLGTPRREIAATV